MEQTVRQATAAMAREIAYIQMSEGYARPDFFQLKRLYVTWMQPWYQREPVQTIVQDEMVFWEPLERELGTKLIAIEESNAIRFLTSQDYIFLVCNIHNYPFEPPKGECLDQFRLGNSIYGGPQQIFDQGPFTIYLLKRTRGG